MPARQGRPIRKVKNLLSIFEGSMPVYIYFEDIGKLTVAPKTLWVTDHPALIQELKRILGEKCVVKKQR